jgi:hypothetical protein
MMDFGFRDFVWEGCGTGCRRDVAVVSTEKLELSTLRGFGPLGSLASKRAAPATVRLCNLSHFSRRLFCDLTGEAPGQLVCLRNECVLKLCEPLYRGISAYERT